MTSQLEHCKGILTQQPCYKMNKQQCETVGLLSIGTFLEYFDLMLYVHMTVILNVLFFPTMDNHSKMALAAMSFSSIYLLRPIGALLFGYIGDLIGRKTTVVITTTMMAFTCLIMGSLPTYQEIGVTATYIFLICRLLQGVSSMGEIVGSIVHTTETVAAPRRHFAVSLIDLSTVFGGFLALFVTWFVTNIVGNWRIAFWIGSTIAVVGSIARIRLRENPEFTNHLINVKSFLKKENISQFKYFLKFFKKSFDKNSLAYVFIKTPFQVSFFTGYIYFNNDLEKIYGYNSEQIINHNLKISLFCLFFDIFFTYLVKLYKPLAIYRFKIIVFSSFMCFMLLWLFSKPSLTQLVLLQTYFLCLGMNTMTMGGFLVEKFNLNHRFTIVAFLWSLSRLAAHLIFIASLVWLSKHIGHYALVVVYTPLIVMSFWAYNHYKKLDRQEEGKRRVLGIG